MSARVRVESDMGWSLLWGTKIGWTDESNDTMAYFFF